MWYDSVGLGFFLARLSGGSATRFLFVWVVWCVVSLLVSRCALPCSVLYACCLCYCPGCLVVAVLGLLAAPLVPLHPLWVPHKIVVVLRT